MQIDQRLVVLLVYVEAMFLTSTAYYSRWGEWGPWTPCNSFCGIGNTERHRPCEDVLGRAADGCGDEEDSIEIAESPQVKGFMDWTDWDEWSSCIGKCGKRFRYRECYDYGQTGFVRGCYGKSDEWEDCGIPSCPKLKDKPKTKDYRILDYASWTDWEEWTHCGRSCGGGKKYRKRECRNERDIHSVLSFTACGGPDVDDLNATYSYARVKNNL
ncbi:A disintegrin and metalloproteinase with thrombospondin motifs adt-1-like [Strongylocentrotus purpuratus]|uniref:Uncharacterized protein n=1 Tax=Strongylocentrotus purpuratus TaxID=7668 RepID=A0A7M7NY83_STRPU|nr:A disintegrin and metalloproteinase with thrombospondin motifs adt-1-like [Strongylocentrotus purpuratus]